jgi:hypothetical protein
MPIYYYRVVDNHTIVVGSTTGPGSWTRVAGVSESTAVVTVSVSSLVVPLAGYGGGFAEFTVTLAGPIGSRSLVDGSSGLTIPRTTCLPPAFLAPGCSAGSLHVTYKAAHL